MLIAWCSMLRDRDPTASSQLLKLGLGQIMAFLAWGVDSFCVLYGAGSSQSIIRLDRLEGVGDAVCAQGCQRVCHLSWDPKQIRHWSLWPRPIITRKTENKH